MAKRKKTSKKPLIPLKYLYTVLVLAALLVFAVLLKSYFKSTVAPEAIIAQNQEVKVLKDFVNKAAELVEEKGEEAFNEFKDEKWFSEDKYIFVYDLNGNTVVLPPQPELEGVNRLNEADSNGIYYVKEMINQAYSKNDGWVNYVYPKPGGETPFEKLGYFKKVLFNGRYYIVGSGVYLE